MSGGRSRQPVSVDVYVRPSHTGDALEEHLATLQRLAAEGVVDEVDVHCWPGRVPTRSPTTDAVDQFQRFRSWAASNDRSIQPPFSVHEVDSEFTGEHRTYLSTPVLTLAVEVGDSLVGVYPHSEGDVHRGVEDGIAALSAGELQVTDGGPAAAARGTCTECGGDLVNVQGVPACENCEWVDRDQSPLRSQVVSR